MKTVPNVFTSNPTIKNVGGDCIIIASGVDGIRKILATGEAFELISFLPYPGHKDYPAKATPAAIQAALDKADAAYRLKDEATILAMSEPMEEIGFNRLQIAGGTYNMIERPRCSATPGWVSRHARTAPKEPILLHHAMLAI